MQITGWFAWRPHRRWLRPTITGVHQTPDSAAAIKLQVRIRMQLRGLAFGVVYETGRCVTRTRDLTGVIRTL